jgi:hypothetical protein
LSKEIVVNFTKRHKERVLGWQLLIQALQPKNLTGSRIIIVTVISPASLNPEDSD